MRINSDYMAINQTIKMLHNPYYACKCKPLDCNCDNHVPCKTWEAVRSAFHGPAACQKNSI